MRNFITVTCPSQSFYAIYAWGGFVRNIIIIIMLDNCVNIWKDTILALSAGFERGYRYLVPKVWFLYNLGNSIVHEPYLHVPIGLYYAGFNIRILSGMAGSAAEF